MDIAVIGSGIAGLACARRLVADRALAANVTVFEADARAGGHANTVDVTLDGFTHPVDTGFLVFNERTYPGLCALFAELGVETAQSEMTFSVRLDDRSTRSALEWAGTNLDTVFAQRSNLASPRFLRMLADIVRFNRAARALAADASEPLATWTLGEYLDAERYSTVFRDWYLLPMAAAIWSCPTTRMREFPLSTFVRFCANHGLLQITDRPQWYTVRGGSRTYVERVVAALPDVRLADPVRSVERAAAGARGTLAVATRQGRRVFDHVVFACHSDQAARLFVDADAEQRALLGAVRYQRNEAVLHTDASVLPSRRKAWAAWNYRCDVDRAASDEARVAVHYLVDKLQPLPFARPVVVSLNATRPVDPRAVLATFDYEHPILDRAALVAQRRLDDVQGRAGAWFCGAWTANGFHEDGLQSGLRVADALARRARADADERLAA